MDDLQYVVNEIVARVNEHTGGDVNSNKQFNETLAAFVAKTVILEHSETTFQLDKQLESDKLDFLVDESVARMVCEDSPSFETLKMQVGFDFAYVSSEQELHDKQQQYKQQLAFQMKKIVGFTEGDDYDSINMLYKQIFNYLNLCNQNYTNLTMPTNGTSENSSKADEREIAAALESVYPKIGLKTFLKLPEEEKRDQLRELANIVIGIRVYNRANGKGGHNIQDIPTRARTFVLRMRDNLENQVAELADICANYSDILTFLHSKGIQDERAPRWREELTNRRQYAAYLGSILEDTKEAHEITTECIDNVSKGKKELDDLVGSRVSVPKEQVYPLFDAIACAWGRLVEETRLLEARHAALEHLQEYLNSFRPTLDFMLLEDMRRGLVKRDDTYRSLHSESKFDEGSGEEKVKDVEESADIPSTAGTNNQEVEGKQQDETTANVNDATPVTKHEGKLADDGDESKHSDEVGGGGGDKSDPQDALESGSTAPGAADVREEDLVPLHELENEHVTLLSVEDTPEFMQLPLEYQGYCPWTITKRNGLLLPGNPALGVVEYDNMFHVFIDTHAMREFMVNPEEFSNGVLAEARRAPQLIHLLHLQEHFPNTALTHLIATAKNVDVELTNGGHAVLVDAATETPVHFVERHIDPNYEFSEWAMRRKALQLANLRKMRTVSQQTEKSNFRRENETQVYLPKETATQTGINRGTNPPRTCQYVSGLRGNYTTKYSHKPKKGQANVVRMRFEL